MKSINQGDQHVYPMQKSCILLEHRDGPDVFFVTPV